MALSDDELAIALAPDADAPAPSQAAIDAAHLSVAKARRENAREAGSAA